MVSELITEIENWYQESPSGTQRPAMLSKLAVIEFCGWLEVYLDSFIDDVNQVSLNDDEWVKKNIINNTYGFHYDKHFRKMLSSILGEVRVRAIEVEFESLNPGVLEDIKSKLGDLWNVRCKIAHADIATHSRQQVAVNAPSWTKNTHRILSKRLDSYKLFVLARV